MTYNKYSDKNVIQHSYQILWMFSDLCTIFHTSVYYQLLPSLNELLQ